MDHVAIMKKQWRLTEKILAGEKTIETRWYMNKARPYDCVHAGDTIYFKDSGSLISTKASVSKVEQFSDLDDIRIKELLKKYGEKDLGTAQISKEIQEYIKGKRYAVIIHLTNPQEIKPFDINKKGFGAMSAWICIDNIENIKV